MLKIKDNVDLKELEKYGFKILIDEKEFEERIRKDSLNFYCTRAVKKIGNHFLIAIENDEYENEIDIVPDSDFPLKMTINWQLDIIYDLIKDDLVEKVNK